MQVKIITDRYVHFDNNGQITKISRDADNIDESIKVDFKQVKGLLEGRESMVDYRVEYDFLDKKYILKHIKVWKQDQLKDAFLYEIKNQQDADIAIVQNKKDKCWELVLGEKLKTAMVEQNLQIDPTAQYYSVTKKHDPNVLYRLLKFKKHDDAYIVPFENDFELDTLDLSVYTVRKFSTYSYEVIDG